MATHSPTAVVLAKHIIKLQTMISDLKVDVDTAQHTRGHNLSEEKDYRKVTLGAVKMQKTEIEGLMIGEGLAIAEGVWTGFPPIPTWYSAQVVKDSLHLFTFGKQMRLEHEDWAESVVGFILEAWWEPERKGIMIKFAIFSPTGKAYIQEGNRGLSIGVRIDSDWNKTLSRDDVNEIKKLEEVTICAAAACNICGVDNVR